MSSGLTCTFQGFVKSYGGLLAARFFLGLFVRLLSSSHYPLSFIVVG